MVESVMPWNRCEPSLAADKNSCGELSQSSSMVVRLTAWNSRFNCSHISELICSRTWRAFSRADMMQETIDMRLPMSKVSDVQQVVGVVLHAGRDRHAEARQHAAPAGIGRVRSVSSIRLRLHVDQRAR